MTWPITIKVTEASVSLDLFRVLAIAATADTADTEWKGFRAGEVIYLDGSK